MQFPAPPKKETLAFALASFCLRKSHTDQVLQRPGIQQCHDGHIAFSQTPSLPLLPNGENKMLCACFIKATPQKMTIKNSKQPRRQAPMPLLLSAKFALSGTGQHPVEKVFKLKHARNNFDIKHTNWRASHLNIYSLICLAWLLLGVTVLDPYPRFFQKRRHQLASLSAGCQKRRKPKQQHLR